MSEDSQAGERRRTLEAGSDARTAEVPEGQVPQGQVPEGPLAPGVVGVVSGLAGAVLGWVTSAWQLGLETSQVQAGTVLYPADNAFYLYHLKLWSLTTQLPALLLWLGVTERLVNQLLTAGLAGAIFAGLSLLTYLYSRRAGLALATPFVVVSAGLNQVGTTYFIDILESPHTFGIAGNGLGLLLMASLGLQRLRWTGALLALAPAVHPPIGGWLLAITGITLALEPARVRERLRELVPGMMVGGTVTAVSFLHHLWMVRSLPAVDPVVAGPLVQAFVASWDDHRNPVRLWSPGIPAGMMGVVLGLRLGFWPWRWAGGAARGMTPGRSDSPAGVGLEDGPLLLLRWCGISALAGLVWSVLSHHQGLLPALAQAAMPWRNLNLTSLALPALVLGLLGGQEARGRGWWVSPILIVCGMPVLWPALTGASVGLLAGALKFLPVVGGLVVLLANAARTGRTLAIGVTLVLSLGVLGLWPGDNLPPLLRLVGLAGLWGGGATLLINALGWAGERLALRRHTHGGGLEPGHGLLRGLWKPGSRPLQGLLLLGFVGAQGLSGWEAADQTTTRLSDRHTAGIYAAMAERPGLLLTASNLLLIQLRSSRPVVLNGAHLNFLPYVPEAAPFMEKALTEAYGISLRMPPGKRAGGLAQEDGRGLWQGRRLEEWGVLAARWGLGGVVTPETWSLQLPVIARGDGLVLWSLPGAPASDESGKRSPSTVPL